MTAVAKAELDLANTTVRATSRGVVTDLTTDVGRYAGTGSPVLTLIGIHDVWINAEFTENNLGHVKSAHRSTSCSMYCRGGYFTARCAASASVSAASRNPSAGTLPSIQNDRDWLRQAQRFPVIIGFDVEQDPDAQGSTADRRTGLRHRLWRRNRSAAAAGQDLHPHRELAVLRLLRWIDVAMPLGARRTFRLGLVTALSLALAYGLGMQFPFLAPLFAIPADKRGSATDGSERPARPVAGRDNHAGRGTGADPASRQVLAVRGADHRRRFVCQHVHQRRARQGPGCHAAHGRFHADPRRRPGELRPGVRAGRGVAARHRTGDRLPVDRLSVLSRGFAQRRCRPSPSPSLPASHAGLPCVRQ